MSPGAVPAKNPQPAKPANPPDFENPNPRDLAGFKTWFSVVEIRSKLRFESYCKCSTDLLLSLAVLRSITPQLARSCIVNAILEKGRVEIKKQKSVATEVSDSCNDIMNLKSSKPDNKMEKLCIFTKPAKTREKPATRQTRKPAKFQKLEPARTRNPPENHKNRPRVHPYHHISLHLRLCCWALSKVV